MREHADDIALVHAARSGDRAAWSRLYGRFAPMVHAVLLARVGRADADDLTQEVFLRALTGLGGLADAGAVGPWLAAIARNAAATLRRSRPTREVPEESAARGAGAPQSAEAAEVMDVIRTMPDAYRETLLMRLVEGLSGSEIAARTGMTPGSVRVNLHRGMSLLRERLGEPAAARGGREVARE